MLTGIGAAAALTAALALAARGPGIYRPGAADDRPPVDRRYQQALRAGLAGDYAGGERQMLALARDARGTSEAAWALYQAGIAERAQRHPERAEALFARLRRDYPGHPLALRTTPVSSGPPEAQARHPAALSDCGPRALLDLCRQAGIPSTLPELRKRCGTTADGTTLDGLARAARDKGMRVEALQVDAWFLGRHRPSGIAWVEGDHYVAFTPGRTADEVSLSDPNEPGARPVTAEELVHRSGGIVLLAAWGTQSLPEVPPIALQSGAK